MKRHAMHQKAVEEGKITATVAADIAKVEPAKQSEALQAAIEAGRGNGAREAVQRVRKPHGEGEDDKPRRIGVAILKRFASAVSEEGGSAPDGHLACALLAAILGEGPRALKDYPHLQRELRVAIGGREK